MLNSSHSIVIEWMIANTSTPSHYKRLAGCHRKVQWSQVLQTFTEQEELPDWGMIRETIY